MKSGFVKLNKLSGYPINLKAIAESGQCFRWKKINDFYYAVVGNLILKLKQIDPETILWQTFPKKNNLKILRHYLNLDKNYEDIIKSINKDKKIYKAIKKYWGLRELSQPFFEALISFIISANNNIKLIERSIDFLCKNWGKKILADRLEFYTFPDAKTLASASEKNLREIARIGFRAKYIKKTSQLIKAKKLIPNKLKTLSYIDARRLLRALPGVGSKIADCILLFSLGHDEAVPIDVWLKRVLVEIYNQSQKSNYEKLESFAQNYFGPYAGWAHQFLYILAREEKLKNSQKRNR